MSKYSTLSPKERFNLLVKDFLDRDDDRFVRIRTSNRLGWEDTLPTRTAYSEAIMHPTNTRDLFLNATELARNMIVSMDPPYKVTLRLSPDKNCTDSKIVYVATKVFDEKKLTLGQKLDTFLGETIHETCHLLYTNFNELPKIKSQIIHSLANIIEDERIERLLGEEKPGLANFLKATKYYYFDKYFQAVTETKQGEAVPEQDAIDLFNSILLMVRYPASLSPETAERFSDELLQVRDILMPYPESTAEVNRRAERIYELLKEFFKKLKEQNQETQGTPDEAEGREGEDGQQDENDPKKKNSNQSIKDGAPQHGDQSQQNGSSENRTISDSEMEAVLKKITDALSKISDDPKNTDKNEKIDKDEMSDSLKNNPTLTAECEGKLQQGKEGNILIVEKEDNKTRYQASLQRVRRYIPAIAAALKAKGTEYQYTITGTRSGILDTNRLAEARQGVENVYIRKGEVKCNKINVVLLIDESGSMEGNAISMARDAAILINEAIGSLRNVTLSIYGFTTSWIFDDLGNNVLFPYRENGRMAKRYSLGSIDNMGGTPTNEAIIESAARLRGLNNGKTLLFVLSDGQANGGCQSVRRATTKIAKRDGIQTIGISIDSSLNEQMLKQMYNEYIVMNKLEDLPTNLAKTIKKAIMNNTNRKHTMI